MEHGPPSFEGDIRPLFRDMDRSSMAFLFDLWSYDDVRRNASAIARMLDAGEMPCDGAWPKDRVQLLRAWVAGGFQP